MKIYVMSRGRYWAGGTQWANLKSGSMEFTYLYGSLALERAIRVADHLRIQPRSATNRNPSTDAQPVQFLE